MDFRELSRQVLSDISRCVEGVESRGVEELVRSLAARKSVFLLGAGRSGTMLRAMAIRLGHLGIAASVVGDAGCPAPAKGGLVLAASGSGRTPAPLAQLTQARAAGADIVLITADPASPMAQLARVVIHIPAPAVPRDGTPHTLRSLFEECLLIVCDGVCRLLQDRLGLSTGDMQSRHSTRE